MECLPLAKCIWTELCDHAFLDQHGKPCLIGLFETITAQTVPVQHNHAALVVKVSGDPSETVALRVEFIQPGGKQMLQIDGHLRLSTSGLGHLTAGLNSLMLPEYGIYAIHVYLNGARAGTRTFAVSEPASG